MTANPAGKMGSESIYEKWKNPLTPVVPLSFKSVLTSRGGSMKMIMTNLAKRGKRPQWAITVLLIGWIVAATASSAFATEGISTEAGPEGPAQTAYAPSNGKPGPVIIAISGHTGPTSYRAYASELAKLGYYVVLVDGKDILNPEHTGPANLSKTIDRARNAPNAVRGKVAVIGFSQGGGGALYNAANMPEAVSMVVAYYPYTRTWANNIDALVNRFRVPVLVMAGGVDRYNNCCVIESMHAMEAAAKARGVPFELVVYPDANHGFNLESGAHGEPIRAYRPDDASDAWRRTVEMLKHYHPLQEN
jgi:carboxymethylenebutenolidase